MPSAIALTYTRGGFAIAADGRERANERILSDTTQKIFSIKDRNCALAYAFGGRVGFDSNDGLNAIDVRKKARYIVPQLSTTSHGDLPAYVHDFSMQLLAALREVHETQQMEPLPAKELDRLGDAHVIFQLFIAGYFQGKPGWCFATFTHENQQLLEPIVRADYPLQKVPVIYGPTEIAKRIFRTDDSTLAAYRVAGFRNSAEPSLSDGIEAVRNYVRGCCDPEIAKLDPERCAGVGGHLHLATITPSSGFEWMVPPMQSSI